MNESINGKKKGEIQLFSLHDFIIDLKADRLLSMNKIQNKQLSGHTDIKNYDLLYTKKKKGGAAVGPNLGL